MKWEQLPLRHCQPPTVPCTALIVMLRPAELSTAASALSGMQMSATRPVGEGHPHASLRLQRQAVDFLQDPKQLAHAAEAWSPQQYADPFLCVTALIYMLPDDEARTFASTPAGPPMRGARWRVKCARMDATAASCMTLAMPKAMHLHRHSLTHGPVHHVTHLNKEMPLSCAVHASALPMAGSTINFMHAGTRQLSSLMTCDVLQAVVLQIKGGRSLAGSRGKGEEALGLLRPRQRRITGCGVHLGRGPGGRQVSPGLSPPLLQPDVYPLCGRMTKGPTEGPALYNLAWHSVQCDLLTQHLRVVLPSLATPKCGSWICQAVQRINHLLSKAPPLRPGAKCCQNPCTGHALLRAHTGMKASGSAQLPA